MRMTRINVVLLSFAALALFMSSRHGLLVLNLANVQLVRSLASDIIESADDKRRFELVLAHASQVSAIHGGAILSIARLSNLPSDPNREQDITILRAMPNSESYFITRGYRTMQRQNWHAAVEDLHLAVEIRPDSAHAQLAWAQAQMYGLDDLEGCIASNLKAIQLDQNFSFLWVEVAHAQQMAGNDELALQSLNKVNLTRHDGYTALAHAIRGVADLNRGRASEAAQELKMAVEISPENLGFRVSYGNALCRLGKGGEARAIWQSVLRTDPSFKPALDADCKD